MHRHAYKFAASIAAICIVAPFALNTFSENLATQSFEKVAQTLPETAPVTNHAISGGARPAPTASVPTTTAPPPPPTIAAPSATPGFTIELPNKTANTGLAEIIKPVETKPDDARDKLTEADAAAAKRAADVKKVGAAKSLTDQRAVAEARAKIAQAQPPASAPPSAPTRFSFHQPDTVKITPDCPPGQQCAVFFLDRDTLARRQQLDLMQAERARLAPLAQGSLVETNRMADLERRIALLQNELNAAPTADQNRDRFETFDANPVMQVAKDPVSTFSLDVDTASYSLVRRSLNAGRLPPKDAVRVEEMINYFPYKYQLPESATEPFRPQITVMPSPWNPANKLVHVGVKGYALNDAQRPRANLVFLIDISGSMQPADRLPLLKNAFRMLVDQLKPDDSVAIVTYASGSDIRLKPTKVSNRATILAAIESLNAGGSTAGAQGIQDAYRVAEANFDKSGVNRIILGTDGDWNVGITNQQELKGFIERKRETGVFLSILGVGMGNHNDALMQTLARNGNGVAAYIDTLAEAHKVLVDEAASSIFPIAKDVKVQIEFNPQMVSAYRLIGYEKRMLKREDFNNDKVDAGDVGSGHTVTVIYEVTPTEAPQTVDALRYAPNAKAPPTVVTNLPSSNELAFLKLRYKLPKEDTSKLLSVPVLPMLDRNTIADVPEDVRFSIAVAAFGQLLKGSPHLKSFTYDDVMTLANSARGSDPFGYRAEFLNLVRLAKAARQ